MPGQGAQNGFQQLRCAGVLRGRMAVSTATRGQSSNCKGTYGYALVRTTALRITPLATITEFFFFPPRDRGKPSAKGASLSMPVFRTYCFSHMRRKYLQAAGAKLRDGFPAKKNHSVRLGESQKLLLRLGALGTFSVNGTK